MLTRHCIIHCKVPKDPKPIFKDPIIDENEKNIRKSYDKFDDNQLFSITIYFTSGLKVAYDNQNKETVIDILYKKIDGHSSILIDKTGLDSGALIDFTRVEYIDVTTVDSSN